MGSLVRGNFLRLEAYLLNTFMSLKAERPDSVFDISFTAYRISQTGKKVYSGSTAMSLYTYTSMAVSIRASSFFDSGKSTFLPSRFVQSMKLARSTSYGSVALTKPDFSLNGL